MSRRKLVVIGNGMTGVRAVEEILSLDGAEQFEISIFGQEPFGQYDRRMLPDLLAGARQETDIYVHPLSWYAEHEITLHCGSRVTEVDRASQVVYARSGASADYDILLLATGARLQMPPLGGIYGDSGKPRPGIFGFRTLDDCRRISACTPASRTVAVLGGGARALSTACALLKRGCRVHVLHSGSYLMQPLLDSADGEFLYERLSALGVTIHLQSAVTELLGKERVTGVAFDDGNSLSCDLVVITEAFEPDVEVAIRAGLSVENAIVVDNHMRSVDDHDVYAIGQCAQHRGTVYEQVAQFWEQAAVCAQHVTGHGGNAAYGGSRPATTLEVAGTAFSLA